MWVTAEAEARAPHEAGRPGLRVRWTGSRDLFPHLHCFNKNTLVGIPVQTKGRTLLGKAGLAAGTAAQPCPPWLVFLVNARFILRVMLR